MNRFSQKDVVRGKIISGTSLNRYLYCQNDPVNFIDPSGMSVRSLLNKGRATITRAVNRFKANPAKSTVQTLRTVSNAIKHPVSTVKKAVKTVRRAITELTRPDPKPQIVKTTVPPTSPPANPPTKDKGSSSGDGAARGRRGSTTQQGSNNSTDALSSGGSTHYSEKSNSSNIAQTSDRRGSPAVSAPVSESTSCKNQTASNKTGDAILENVLSLVSVGAVGISFVVAAANPVGAAVLLGAGVSSLIGGMANKTQGGSFAAGWVGGAVSGAATGFGLGAGSVILGNAFGAAAASAGSVSAAFGKSALLATVFGGIGGFTGSSLTQFIDEKKINLREAAKDGFVSALLHLRLLLVLFLGPWEGEYKQRRMLCRLSLKLFLIRLQP